MGFNSIGLITVSVLITQCTSSTTLSVNNVVVIFVFHTIRFICELTTVKDWPSHCLSITHLNVSYRLELLGIEWPSLHHSTTFSLSLFFSPNRRVNWWPQDELPYYHDDTVWDRSLCLLCSSCYHFLYVKPNISCRPTLSPSFSQPVAQFSRRP